MDEVLPGCIAVIAGIAFVVWLAGIILKGLALLFVTLSFLFGHPLVVVMMTVAACALIGLARHRRLRGAPKAGSTDDYAAIGGMRLVPEGWALAVFSCALALLALFGSLVL